jgi:hypothetical protein
LKAEWRPRSPWPAAATIWRRALNAKETQKIINNTHMKKLPVCIAALALLSIGAARAMAYGDVNDGIYSPGDYTERGGSFDNIPAGAHVICEVGVTGSGDAASAVAWGDYLDPMEESSTGPGGGDNEADTAGEGTVSYDISASGTAYALVDVEWGF